MRANRIAIRDCDALSRFWDFEGELNEITIEKKKKTNYNVIRLSDEERQMIQLYKKETDQQLYGRIRQKAEELGRLPKKRELTAWLYLTRRLGPWPRVLEQAGLKEISATYERKQAKRKKKRRRE